LRTKTKTIDREQKILIQIIWNNHRIPMFIGWLTRIPAVLLPHSLCRSTTANAPANGTFRETDTAKCPYPRSLWASVEKKKYIKS